jgi:hypothetical protein
VEILHPRNNFNGGQLSGNLSCRYDLKAYQNGLLYCKNWVPRIQGGLFYAPGFEFIRWTKGNGVAKNFAFTFNESQTYTLEHTDNIVRFYDDDGILLEASKNLTGATQANPCELSSGSHGYTDGDEVYVASVGGMTELNGQFYIVANATTHTFTLKDLDGVDIDSSAFGAYTSGGTVSRVYEIESPYDQDDFDSIKYAQQGDITYFVDRFHEQYKLTRLSELNWTMERYTRTSDPFTTAISGITKANPGVVTTAEAHGLSTGDLVIIHSVAGMTEINEQYFLITVSDTTHFSLRDPDTGANFDTSGYSIYTSGGIVACTKDQPGAVAFYGGRYCVGGTVRDPDYFWLSMLPEDDGTPRYDTFTVSSDAASAVVFPIKSINNTFDEIRLFAGTAKFLAIGSLGGMYKVTGATGDGSTITASSLSVVPVDYCGGADIQPVFLSSSVFYVKRGKRKINSFEYDLLMDSYASNDQTLISDELSGSGIKELAYTRWFADILWALRTDGRLLGLVYKSKEQIAGWFFIDMAGTDAKILSISGQVREEGYDVLYCVVERTINGVTRRSQEKMTIDVDLPERMEIYTGDKTADDLKWRKLMYEAQKKIVRLHSAIIYDGTQTADLVLSAGTGVVTATASVAMFSEDDVGREIEAKIFTGEESGVGRIIEYVNSTIVMVEVLEEFTNLSLSSGAWYLSTDRVTGAKHLEGEIVSVLGDGGIAADAVVENGVVELDGQYTYVIVGLKYKGIAALTPLVPQDQFGIGFTKTKTINQVSFNLRNSLGLQFGTDLYKLATVEFSKAGDYTHFPPALFTGETPVQLAKDGYSQEKVVYFYKEDPQPCEIRGVAFRMETAET